MFREISKTVEVNVKDNIVTLRKIDSETLEFRYFFMLVSEAKKLCEVIEDETRNN